MKDILKSLGRVGSHLFDFFTFSLLPLRGNSTRPDEEKGSKLGQVRAMRLTKDDKMILRGEVRSRFIRNLKDIYNTNLQDIGLNVEEYILTGKLEWNEEWKNLPIKEQISAHFESLNKEFDKKAQIEEIVRIVNDEKERLNMMGNIIKIMAVEVDEDSISKGRTLKQEVEVLEKYTKRYKIVNRKELIHDQDKKTSPQFNVSERSDESELCFVSFTGEEETYERMGGGSTKNNNKYILKKGLRDDDLDPSDLSDDSGSSLFKTSERKKQVSKKQKEKRLGKTSGKKKSSGNVVKLENLGKPFPRREY